MTAPPVEHPVMSALFCACVFAVATDDRLQVVKYGASLFVRSPFSEAEDLVRVGKGSNGQVDFNGAK